MPANCAREPNSRWKDDAEIESTTLRLKVKCVVLEDDTEGDPLRYDLQSATELTEEAENSYLFPIENGSPVTKQPNSMVGVLRRVGDALRSPACPISWAIGDLLDHEGNTLMDTSP